MIEDIKPEPKSKTLLDPKLISELKEKHGNTLVAVAAARHTLVFRKPTRGEYDRWNDKIASDKANLSTHNRELACSCIVHPSEDALREVLDDQPGILGIEIINAIGMLAGLADEITVAKL